MPAAATAAAFMLFDRAISPCMALAHSFPDAKNARHRVPHFFASSGVVTKTPCVGGKKGST
jgi:hypothetical protein